MRKDSGIGRWIYEKNRTDFYGARMMSKLAVFFPGIGYTVDKPLLYYSRDLAAEHGYEEILLPYGGFPKNAKSGRDKMEENYRIALSQAEEMLVGIDFGNYDDVLFIGKSIGTIVAGNIMKSSPYQDRIRMIFYTPLEESFAVPLKNVIVFTGAEDPWVGREKSRIPEICREMGIPCSVIPGANHSLETQKPLLDIENLKHVMQETDRFMR